MTFRSRLPATYGDIAAVFERLERMEKRIMNALDALKAGLTGLGQDIDAELAAIEAKLAGGTSDADLQGLSTQIGALRSKVQAETASLTGTPITPVP